jgi:hypothetical protein
VLDDPDATLDRVGCGFCAWKARITIGIEETHGARIVDTGPHETVFGCAFADLGHDGGPRGRMCLLERDDAFGRDGSLEFPVPGHDAIDAFGGQAIHRGRPLLRWAASL